MAKSKVRKKAHAKLAKANEKVREGLATLVPLEDVLAPGLRKGLRLLAKGFEWNDQVEEMLAPKGKKKKKKKVVKKDKKKKPAKKGGKSAKKKKKKKKTS